MSEKPKDPLGEPEHHESYGMLRFNRTTVGLGGCTLFGSSIRHGNIISLTISRADKRRNLSLDSFYSGDELIRVELSYSQFVEAIAAMDTQGVPCTLSRFGGESIPRPPSDAKRAQFDDEFKASCQKVATKCDELRVYADELRSKPSVSKKDRDDLLSRIDMLRQQLASSLPFVLTQFNRQMDRTVMEAKGEVEAFVQNRIIGAGLEALGGKPVTLAIEGETEGLRR